MVEKREYILVTNKGRMFRLYANIEKKFGKKEKILSYALEDFKYLGRDNQKNKRILNVAENISINSPINFSPRPLLDLFQGADCGPFDDIDTSEYVIEVFLKISPIPFK